MEDSVRSVEMIDGNYLRLRGEVFGGLADNAKIVCIGNVIRNDGLALRLKKDYRLNQKWNVQELPVEKNGVITWSARFTNTGEP